MAFCNQNGIEPYIELMVPSVLHRMSPLTVLVQLFEQLFILTVRTFINVPYFMMGNTDSTGMNVR